MPFNKAKIWQYFIKKQVSLYVSQGEDDAEMYQIRLLLPPNSVE